MKQKRLLLHICCAPDAAWIPEKLGSEYDVTCFFYNPNIFPSREHEKRAAEMRRLAAEKGYALVAPTYEPGVFEDRVGHLMFQPEKSGRCSICYRLRLEATARYGKANGFDCFATVLTVSPHKWVERINRIGEAVAAAVGIEYLPSDFKKQDGYRRSVEESKRLNLYRQDYCGCESSLRYREMFKAMIAQSMVPLVSAERVGVFDVQSFRKWLDRHGLQTGFLFFETTPTRAVFREAYEQRLFLEPTGNRDWRERVFRKKGVPIRALKLTDVSDRSIFSDPF